MKPLVTKDARRATRHVTGSTSLSEEKAQAHRADRRAAKAALRAGKYDRYLQHRTPTLTAWEVS